MSYKFKRYPTWEEIKDDLDKEDLVKIINNSIGSTIEESLFDFISEYYEMVEDIDYDRAYDEYREDMMYEQQR